MEQGSQITPVPQNAEGLEAGYMPTPYPAEVPMQPSFDASKALQHELLNDTFKLGRQMELFVLKLQQARVVDPRWVEKAKTHFQEGLSAARRAVNKNDSF